MVWTSILVNDNMVVKQIAYSAINVIENYVNNVTYEIQHIKRLQKYTPIVYVTLF